MTPAKPICSASTCSSRNSSGRTQRFTGWCRGEGPQVLRDGDDLSAGLVQINERSRHLGARLAHAQDQVALGYQPKSRDARNTSSERS